MLLTAIAERQSVLSRGGEPLRSAIDSLKVQGLLQANEAIRRQDDDQPLDAYYKELTRTIKGLFAKEATDDDYGEYMATLLTSIEEKACEFTCADCTSGGPICGSDLGKNDEIVHEFGLCIEPFQELFREARSVAAAWYAQHCSLAEELPLPRIEFGTGHDGALESVLPQTPFFISADTTFFDDEPLVVARLIFRTSKFHWNCYLSALYLLFHECIVHAYQDLYPEPAREGRAEAFDAFAEGWMDWIALQILHQHLDGVGPRGESLTSSTCKNIQHRAPTMSALAERYHDARADCSHEEYRHPTSGIVHCGRSVASRIAEIFEEEMDGDSDEGWRRMVELSFDLNVRGDLRDARRSFAILAEASLAAEPTKVRENVRAYISSGDPRDILRL